jgi:hypothetical protein
LLSGALNDLAQYDVVRMGVLLACARFEVHFAVADRVIYQLLVREGAQGLGKRQVQEALRL